MTTRTSHEPQSQERPVRFDGYEIHGVKRYCEDGHSWCEPVDDKEADFWSLYGHIPGEGVVCIGDFSSREFAEEIYAHITGSLWRDGRAA
jgi:hypothetical protein